MHLEASCPFGKLISEHTLTVELDLTEIRTYWFMTVTCLNQTHTALSHTPAY